MTKVYRKNDIDKICQYLYVRSCGLKLIFLIPIMLMARSSKAQELPIKPTRTFSFDTTEGSYMDVDLSSDGTKIVFDLLGDIYTMPVTGGNATQLTHGLAYNLHPVWSHNGKQIAYMSDASGAMHVNIMNSDGTSQRPLERFAIQVKMNRWNVYAPQCEWAPDDAYVIAGDKLYHIAGGSITLPQPVKDKNIIQFSLDGNFIYYNNNYVSINDYVESYDRHNATVTKFAQLPKGAVNPQISLDRNWLTYITEPALESNLVIRNIITGKERVLIPCIEYQYRRMQEHYTFTSDSRYLLIGFNGKIHKIDIQNGNDHIISFNAKVHVDLGPLNYNTYKLSHDSLDVRYTRSANESPDGRSLVFAALNRVYIMALPTGKPHILVEQSLGQYQPIYSPDGKWISFVTRSDTKGGALWRVSCHGGIPEKLTNDAMPAIYSEPTWSPDGTHIAILRSTEVTQGVLGVQTTGFVGELQIISIKDRVVQKVADSIPTINSLAFSSDGNRIIFLPAKDRYSRTEEQPALVSLDLFGNNKCILAINLKREAKLIDPNESGQEQIILSPDNRYIVYEINEDLYLSPNPALGGPVILNSTIGTLPIIRFAIGGVDPHWEIDGKMLSWSYGNQFFRVNPDKIVLSAIEFAKNGARIGESNNGTFDVRVPSEEIITINIKTPKYYAHGTLALRDARIISMKNNEVIEHGTIVITNGKFTSVGPIKSVHIPSGTKIIDVKGKTIMPGLIDLHDHVHTSLSIFEQQSWKFLANLAYGVTTARDPSNYFDSYGYKELLETGQMIGPRLFTAGDPVIYDLKSLENAREVVQKKAFFGEVTVKQYLQHTRLQKQWLLMASTEQGLNMTNEGDDDPAGDIAMIKDGSTGVEHSPKWGKVYNDILQFIAKCGTWHTPTLQIGHGKAARPYFRNLYRRHPDGKLTQFWPIEDYQNLMKSKAPVDSVRPDFLQVSNIEAKIRHLGGHVTLGAHGNDPGIGSQWELWALQMGGLTNMEALQASTINGAEALGMQADLGSIEVGKLADLIILDKNPLADIHNTMSIKYVMKDGILYDGNALYEIWPIKTKKPTWKYRGSSTLKINDNPIRQQNLNEDRTDDEH